jgi:type I restriction enzyme R subunit
MTGAQYEKKVRDYLRNHLDQIAVHRLRMNEPLTETDLHGLENILVEIGEDQGEALLSDMLARNGAPSLGHFVRSLVGMDREAAQAMFARFLNDRSLTPPQIRFIEMIVDQLTARGIMDAAALYEPPFSNLHSGGPDALFAGKDALIADIFKALQSAQPQLGTEAG